jgi:4-aminobutyrate aminotransferase-like enzyme/Ser/Thr protein kinase RdoA (MazF antagonist)
MLDQAPRLGVDDAERLAREHFTFEGRATPLTSERDQNFQIERSDGSRIVLKIANANESRAMIEAHQNALVHLSSTLTTTPRLLDAFDGSSLVDVRGEDGKAHQAWAITWLPGHPLATATRRTPELYEDFGRQVAALDRALAGFDHPAIHRDFYWDLANGRAIIDQHGRLIVDAELRGALDHLVSEFDRTTAPLLDRLPRAAVHSDLNDYNVLVGGGDDVETRGQRVTGIVDFGDMVYSYRVGDLAIAIAYAILDSDDPLTIASHVVRGYHEHIVPDDNELACVFGLVALRLCMSACIAADQRRQRPDNLYLGVSQSSIQRMLPRLAAIPFGLAQAVLREAAGVESVPASARVAEFLRRQHPAPVIGFDLGREPSIVLDLSVASPLLSGDARENVESELTQRTSAMMRESNVRVAIGRYDEPRLIYVAPAFVLGEGPTDEHRTIHIGLDLFSDAGTPVFAPLAGTVYAFADNATPQDYGPVIVLRHATDAGTEFFTLYGHLSRESLRGLEVGRRVEAGDRIATLGVPAVNGGWTPHLHLQIITDLLGLDTDFPGVARPTQRSVWRALCPDPNLLARVPADRFPAPAPTKTETLAHRRARIGHNLSVAYKDPVKIVRGWMQYLYDDDGRCYIDAYNNVPHVGHCHPRVVEAGAAQMRVLSTNTRYLNDRLTDYADRLLATLPPSLDVCYFVNSASEANELALRLTRAYTGRRDMIVLEAAYHGNTTSLIDISPYKHAGPGGRGAPDWVHVAPLPDDYRGAFRRDDAAAGEKYAEQVGEIVDAIHTGPRHLAGFIAETCPSVGGQLIFPPGYLAGVYAHVRRAGGLCIADEVQTGLGRMGTSFWAFEDHGVVPDIVVMGKPLGNGHPIGAVATTRAIADAFDNGMEFFSTFGGNTVSCAIGIAVLDVLRDEALQAHALAVGDRMLARLRPLIDRYPIVGDVRGSGLFLGVELVRDRGTLEPAGAEASFIANRMRERGVLLGTDGPHHNVVKIRPPMPFSEGDADLLVDALERSIAELPV